MYGLVCDSNYNKISQKQKTQNDASHPSDSLLILAETAINQIHRDLDESTNNHHMENESPSYVELMCQMFPRKAKSLESNSWE